MERENKNYFFDSIDSYLCNFILNGHFVPLHFVINEVVVRLYYLWTTEEKRKMQLGFKLST